jgi:DNA helicase HerA-like ATPase
VSATFRVKLRSNERVNLFGRTGSGKTTQARRLLTDASSRMTWVVLDAKHDFYIPGVKVTGAFSPRLRQQIVRIPPYEEEQLAYDDVIWRIWERGDSILYIDETTLVCPTRTLRPALGAAIRTGRSRGLGVWCASQRPKDLPSAIFTETEHFFVFQLNFEADREKVVSFTSDGLYAPLSRIRGHDFVYWNVLSDTGRYVKALPARGRKTA